MATTTPIRSGYDTWVSSDSPSTKHPRDNRLRLQGSSIYGYVYFPLGPELRNTTILTAPLYLYGRGTGWGSVTLTARRITERWDAATLSWSNKPTVGTTTATLTQTNPDDGTEWAIDLASLVSEFSSGAKWYGVRLELSGTDERRFNSLNANGSKPRMDVRWTDAPAAPTDLSPSGDRAVSTGRPVLSWSNDDSPAGTNITAFEVQVDPAANAAAPVFTGADVAELDLSQTDYAGLADGASTQWRVRVQNDSDKWSAWSDWASFSRADLGTTTIVTPGSTVVEFTPPVAWRTSFPQTAWQLLVTDPMDASDVLHNSGRKPGTTQDYTIPEKDPATGRRILRDDRDYRLVVRTWDGLERESVAGNPAWSLGVAVFHYVDDPTPNKVTNLTAEQVPGTPYVDLTWSRTTTPDAWTIVANGRPVALNIAGADLLISGTSYRFRYKDARPSVAVSYQVKPVVNGGTGPSPTVTLTTVPTGLWVLGPDDIDVLIDYYDNFGTFSMRDRATTITLPQALTPVRVTQGVGGFDENSSVRGVLWDTVGRTADEWADRMLKIKRQYTEPVTIYFGERVIQARLFDILVEPSEDGRTIPVSFGFFEIGVPEYLD